MGITKSAGDFREKVKDFRVGKDATLVILLFILYLVIVFAVLLPNLSDINPWDEAAYVQSGVALMEGKELPTLAGNPLTALFFGLIYLPFKSSILWMVHSVSLARVILLALLWLGTYLVAREFSDFASPLIALGFLVVTPLAIEMLRFPSDPLFTAFAALSLWQFIRYYRSSNLRNIILASVFMALAALARNDGLILFVIFIFLTLVISIRRSRWWLSLIAAILPFIIIVGGYVLISGLITGDFSLEIAERTYSNFESGQQLVYSGTGEFNPVVEARMEARRIFGTGEENNFSVFRAIARNPGEYFKRLVAVLKQLPDTLLHAYGIRFTAVLFLFLLVGIAELIRRKQYALALILVLWPAHLATGFVITLFREGHLQFPFYVVFILAAIGLSATIARFGDKRTRWIVSVLLIALCIYGIFDNKMAIFYGASLALVALWVIFFLQRKANLSLVGALFIMLCAGLILHGDYPSPKLRTLGDDPKEKAVTYLTENFAEGTLVAAGSPGVVWAAKMEYAGLTSADVPMDRSSEEFLDWLRAQGIGVLYVDHDLYTNSPVLWSLIEPQIGVGLERVFVIEQGNYQILVIPADT